MSGDCVFCKIAAGAIPSSEVYSDDEFYAFRDIHPSAPAHILLIPRRHIEKITDLRAEDASFLGRFLLAANTVAQKEGIDKEGFRYVLNCDAWGGQEVFHIHMHILGGRPMAWPPG